jgi:type VI secretion system secreted protein Hcp
MAMTAYLKLQGTTQGEIAGEASQVGNEGLIEVSGFNHSLTIPTDKLSGLPIGQRIHGPLKVLTVLGMQSPKIMQACTSGEILKECSLQFYRLDEKGQKVNYYTIKLENATIVGINLRTPETFLEENKPYRDMEEIEFSYSKIVHVFVPKGIEAEDDWNAPINS